MALTFENFLKGNLFSTCWGNQTAIQGTCGAQERPLPSTLERTPKGAEPSWGKKLFQCIAIDGNIPGQAEPRATINDT